MNSFLRRFNLGEVGVVIPGLMLNGRPASYPVLNERAVRAGAGMMSVAGLFAFFHAFYLADFTYINALVIFFFVDFLLKTVVGTRYSPVSRLADLIVRKQTPEYVGAIQKRFAWSIGLLLATVMLVLIYGFGVTGGLLALVICGVCLTFMFMESAFGICVGCKIYSFLLAHKILPTPVERPVCPGNVCAIE